ncbi:MAG: cation:proton antiporter [Thermodesulfobacteriota bacterium]|nr:cation:proton antiporter [Thermodesulfobacteriota bacterium]
MLLILCAAWGLGYIFTRFGLPLMLGELLAGVILGPPLLGWVTSSAPLALLAEFGVFFAMFFAGLEMDPKELVEHKWPSALAALGGFALPFFLGYTITRLLGGAGFQPLFTGLCISITAVPVQSVILKSMRINRSAVGHIVIGAAVLNDVMALVVLSILIGLAHSGVVTMGGVAWLVIKVFAFFGLTIALGHFVIPRLTRSLTDEAAKGFTFAITVALAMAYLAELAGLHLIMGAFMGGQLVRREIMDDQVYEAIADRFYGIAYGFLIPIFFASLAFHLRVDWSWNFFALALLLTLAAIIGKLAGSGLAVRLLGSSNWESTVVGLGMNSRGAVELVMATVVIELSNELTASGAIIDPLLTQNQFSALVLLAFITTFFTALTLKWAVIRSCLPDEKADFCLIMDEAPRK